MKKQSAGILLYRRNGPKIEVLLAHPGGPFWTKKDAGAWSIPKGEAEPGESDLLKVAKREFAEEVGQPAPDGPYIPLGSFKRSDGKEIFAWSIEGALDVAKVKSNTFEMEWPPKSGTMQQFPEIDRARWFAISDAAPKMHKGQSMFIDALATQLGVDMDEPPQQQSLL